MGGMEQRTSTCHTGNQSFSYIGMLLAAMAVGSMSWKVRTWRTQLQTFRHPPIEHQRTSTPLSSFTNHLFPIAPIIGIKSGRYCLSDLTLLLRSQAQVPLGCSAEARAEAVAPNISESIIKLKRDNQAP